MMTALRGIDSIEMPRQKVARLRVYTKRACLPVFKRQEGLFREIDGITALLDTIIVCQ